MSESRETRLRRLKLRSMRRGIREMDLVLGHFAQTGLATLSEPELATYEHLLAEPDHDVLAWIFGTSPAPEPYAGLVARLAQATAAAGPDGFSAL